MFGVRSIIRLGSAAWGRLRPVSVRVSCPVPPRPRLSVEPLADRLVPSANFTSLSDQNLPQALAGAGSFHVGFAPTPVQFVEIPASGPWQEHIGSLAPLVSPQQLFVDLGGAAALSQLGTPTITGSTIEYGGATFPTLVFQFGTSITVNLAYNTTGADAQLVLVGGLLNVDVGGYARRFLIGHDDGELDGPMPPPILDAFHTDDRAEDSDPSSVATSAPRPGTSGLVPSSLSAGASAPTLASFIAGWSNGRQMADGLAGPMADGTWVNTVEVAVNAGNPADVLLAVDTVLPDARPDLIRLKDADLAVVPAYVIGDVPGAPAASARADDQLDSGLMARVVGLDDLPSGVPPAPVSVEQLLDLLGAAGTHDAQPGEIEVRDAGFALGEWFEEILNQSGSGAVVAALVLEGALVAYVYRRSRRIGHAIRASQILLDRPREKT